MLRVQTDGGALASAVTLPNFRVTNSEFVRVALLIQLANYMCPVVLSSMTCLLYLVFPQYLTNGKLFGKKL